METPTHPGVYVRRRVIPKGVTVTEAAKLLRIGRPALSTLLSGRSALSSEMARRIESVFGEPAIKLLRMQSEYDVGAWPGNPKIAAIGPYVPLLGRIRQEQIEAWSSRIQARSRLPVLLRILVHSTGRGLARVQFPGNESSQSHGVDGIVLAKEASAWVPQGRSCWEFGCNRDPNRKAARDYATRSSSETKDERAKSTFVFVTPRRWPRKRSWASVKCDEGRWKEVRAYDADDLEQWLEQSIPATAWFVDELGLLRQGVQTLDGLWREWAELSEPPITCEIFSEALGHHRGEFKKLLTGLRNHPLLVTGSTEEEVLAFLACLARDGELQDLPAKLGLVFNSANSVRELAASKSPLVPIVRSEEAINEAVRAFAGRPCVLVRSKGQIYSKADITLGQLSHGAFEKALTAMGLQDQTDRLALDSGRSPTILRRVLSRHAAVKTPLWAREEEIARSLIPIALGGAWKATREADCRVLSAIGECTPQEIERSVTRLLSLDDCPIWSVGEYRGVMSKIDSLFAIRAWIIKEDLNRYLEQAERVLSVPDPASELPEEQRWAAAAYGKERPHSDRLRSAIRETLVVLAVHGRDLFAGTIGIDVKAEVARLVQRLLTPLTYECLLSYAEDLPDFAEAAPEEFLGLLDQDLRQDKPVAIRLMGPVEDTLFGPCPRTGLLWALECLAWNPRWLSRASLALAKLSRIPINDNIAHTPINSLKAIYRSWMPQTAVGVADRERTLRMLANHCSGTVKEICLDQLDRGMRFADETYRPRWRNDASGAGQIAPDGERQMVERQVLDLVLDLAHRDRGSLADLVEHLPMMERDSQDRVWRLIDDWASESSDDTSKAGVRDEIRRVFLTPRGSGRGVGEDVKRKAQETYELLKPSNTALRHLWLFVSPWVDVDQEEHDDLGDDNSAYDQREKRVHELRISSMKEIWAEDGFDGVRHLLLSQGDPHTVGHYAALCVSGVRDSIRFVNDCLAVTEDLEKESNACIQALLLFVDSNELHEVIWAVTKDSDPKLTARVLCLTPFSRETWELVQEKGEGIRSRYWKSVNPRWPPGTADDLYEAIARFLEAGRPGAAFKLARTRLPDVETKQLLRVLFEMPTAEQEPTDSVQMDAYYITKALNALESCAGVSSAEMARLELVYTDALDHVGLGMPNLEKDVAKTPATFAWAVAMAYRRTDGVPDPPEWVYKDSGKREAVAHAAHRLLDRVRRIPGADDQGRIDSKELMKWVSEVRALCAEHGRAKIGDECVGRLLARDGGDEGGIRPCEAICDVMDAIGSEHMALGFWIGVNNSRGVQIRGAGGGQERKLAEEYRDLAVQVGFEYPFVASVLERIARSYEQEGAWWDSEGGARDRLAHLCQPETEFGRI